jgi:formate dehydrogenase iron-sulfur subunit
VKRGQATACAQACPTGATKFGERDQLLQEAQARIDANPSNYVNHIYGKEEVGGTSVLLLSAVPFEQFGYPSIAKVGDKPLPQYTGVVMNRIPDFVPLWAVVLGGIYWLANRKNEVAEAEAMKKHGGAA